MKKVQPLDYSSEWRPARLSHKIFIPFFNEYSYAPECLIFVKREFGNDPLPRFMRDTWDLVDHRKSRKGITLLTEKYDKTKFSWHVKVFDADIKLAESFDWREE